MPQIGDVGLYHDLGSDKPAVVTGVHLDGSVDLHILSTTTRRIPVGTAKGSVTLDVESPAAENPRVSALEKELAARETTSAKVASTAGKVLQDEKSSPEAKSIAASALTQAADNRETFRPEASSPVMPWGTGPRPLNWDDAAQNQSVRSAGKHQDKKHK
jgi:hypothetical protein